MLVSLAVKLTYNPERPVVCMDEKPYQLLGDAREPLPMRPGDNQKIDFEYVWNGTCTIFAFVEPLGGTHHINVREHRTAFDWAEEIKYLVDAMYPDVEKIILVMDNQALLPHPVQPNQKIAFTGNRVAPAETGPVIPHTSQPLLCN